MPLTPSSVSISLASRTTQAFQNKYKANCPREWFVQFVNVKSSGDYLDETRWTLSVGDLDFAREGRLALVAGSETEEDLLQKRETLVVTIVYDNGDDDAVEVTLAS